MYNNPLYTSLYLILSSLNFHSALRFFIYSLLFLFDYSFLYFLTYYSSFKPLTISALRFIIIYFISLFHYIFYPSYTTVYIRFAIIILLVLFIFSILILLQLRCSLIIQIIQYYSDLFIFDYSIRGGEGQACPGLYLRRFKLFRNSDSQYDCSGSSLPTFVLQILFCCIYLSYFDIGYISYDPARITPFYYFITLILISLIPGVTCPSIFLSS